MFGSLGSVFSSVFGGLLDLFGTSMTNSANSANVAQTNQTNAENVAGTNTTNLKIAREANAANAEQAELAYQRSKPVQQIYDMMQAGMSKSAAANKIAGGGTYSPFPQVTATMQPANAQAAHVEKPDLSLFARALESAGNVPANMLQREIQEQNLQDLKQVAAIRQKDEIRQQEMHDLALWEKKHGKKTAEMLDSFASKVVQTAAAKNYDISRAKTSSQIIRDLGLEKDDIYQSMPSAARSDLWNAIKSQNDQYMSQQTHDKNLREMDDKHALNQQTLADLQAKSKDFDAAQNAREKEYALRALRASADQVAVARNLTLDQVSLRDVYEFEDGNVKIGKDGMPVLKENSFHGNHELYGKIRGFWNDLSDILPVNVVSQLARFIIK